MLQIPQENLESSNERKYLSLRHTIRRRIKDSHEAYLECMLGLDGKGQPSTTPGQVDSKKLFQFLKSSRTDQQGIPPLKKNDQLYTDTTEKANILNEQFQSVFTPLSPLSLKEISLMKVQDLVDNKVIETERLPEDLRNPTPVMPEIQLSTAGILKLLKKSQSPEGSRP